MENIPQVIEAYKEDCRGRIADLKIQYRETPPELQADVLDQIAHWWNTIKQINAATKPQKPIDGPISRLTAAMFLIGYDKDVESFLIDLLADARHYADHHALDYRRIDTVANGHYKRERKEAIEISTGRCNKPLLFGIRGEGANVN